MLRSLLRPSLMLACVVASGCGPALESEQPLAEETVTQSLRWPKWIRVVAADLIGGLEGAGVGGAAGTVFGPTGTVIGAGVGAIAYGAQASGEAAAKLTTTQGMAAGSVSRGGPANSANPYDYVGRNHNGGLDKMVSIIGPGGCIPNPFPFPFPRGGTRGPLFDFAGAAMKAPAEMVKSPAMQNPFDESLDYVASTLQDEDVEVSIQKRVKSGKMSQAVGERLIRYFTVVAPLDTDKMIEATRSFEKDTLADKSLLEQERVNLLSAYSVARYSAVYWAEQAARGKASPWASCPVK